MGVPSPTVVWTQDGSPLETNSKRLIAKNGTLSIRDCQRGDEANFTCSVENTWGKDEITYRIKVNVPPEAPSLTVLDTYTDSLKLQWSDNNNGGSQILGETTIR